MSTAGLVGICLAALVFLVGVLAAACFCHRNRHSGYGSHKIFGGKKYKAGPEKPLAFHQHRKPTAVKSPAGTGGNTHYLKKSPSPTGGKSPPGVSDTEVFLAPKFFFFDPDSFFLICSRVAEARPPPRPTPIERVPFRNCPRVASFENPAPHPPIKPRSAGSKTKDKNRALRAKKKSNPTRKTYFPSENSVR